MTTPTIADISGTGATVAIGTGIAKWIKFSCEGTGPVRVGDSNAGVARGVAIAAGQSIEFPSYPLDAGWDGYNLAHTFAYIPSSTTLSITYGAG